MHSLRGEDQKNYIKKFKSSLREGLKKIWTESNQAWNPPPTEEDYVFSHTLQHISGKY